MPVGKKTKSRLEKMRPDAKRAARKTNRKFNFADAKMTGDEKKQENEDDISKIQIVDSGKQEIANDTTKIQIVDSKKQATRQGIEKTRGIRQSE